MAIEDAVLAKLSAVPFLLLGTHDYEPGGPLQRLGDVLLWVGLAHALPFVVVPPRREPGGAAGYWVPAACRTRDIAESLAARWNDSLGPSWQRTRDFWTVRDTREVGA